jgi:hypothetical protein
MSRNEMYEEYGCANRNEYLEMLADENGVSYEIVLHYASILGPSEDFDGLVCEIEDLGIYGEY